MGLETVGYEAVLQDYFITPSVVTLQDNVRSTESIEHLLWLDMLSPEGGKKGYFIDKKDSPLTNIFRSNRYHITTGFSAERWSFEKGDYVNGYLYLASASSEFSQTMLYIDNGTTIWDDLRGFGMYRMLRRYITSPNLVQFLSDLKGIEEGDKGPSKNARWHRVVEN